MESLLHLIWQKPLIDSAMVWKGRNMTVVCSTYWWDNLGNEDSQKPCLSFPNSVNWLLIFLLLGNSEYSLHNFPTWSTAARNVNPLLFLWKPASRNFFLWLAFVSLLIHIFQSKHSLFLWDAYFSEDSHLQRCLTV